MSFNRSNPQVKVKALEWRGSEGVWAKADALFGATYRVTEYAGMAKPFKLETVGFVGPHGHYELIEEAKAAAQADYDCRILAALGAAPQPAATDANWRDDPSADERWNAGLDYGQTQLCKVLGVDPDTVSWDAATETLDGDVQSVIGNILTARFGDDWRAAGADAMLARARSFRSGRRGNHAR